jgi:nitrogenase molybdenum-cofactor synthesis protein NifE
MKDLWQYIPPFSPDTSGFAAVLYGTDGIGVIDDVRGCSGNHFAAEESRPGLCKRVAVSKIGNEDAVLGTRDKILTRFRQLAEPLNPTFVLLCGSPISSLIGTDLGAAAEAITQESGLPASHVDLSGHDAYDEGLSRTLECLAKLLTIPYTGPRAGINLLGANHIDWVDAQVDALSGWAAEQGLSVLANWGGEACAADMRFAATAVCNLAVTVSGIRAAKWLRQAYGTPFVAGAPFGRAWSQLLLQALEHGVQPLPPPPVRGGARCLLVGEQLTCNALRATLRAHFGFGDVAVASFFRMEKGLMESGDIRLRSEADCRDLLTLGGFPLIFGDPFLEYYVPGRCRFIPLPHRAISAKLYLDLIPELTGDQADCWLESIL